MSSRRSTAQVLDLVRAGVEVSFGEPRLDMANVEPDDVPDRVGEEHDAENGNRREEAHHARKERSHDEEPASDDGGERRQGRAPPSAVPDPRAREDVRRHQARDNQEEVERRARCGHG